MKIIRAADLFCGAGGTSTGLVRALRKRGYDVELTAINHWDVAVATHRRNHPEARVLHTSVDAVNPLDLFKPGQLDLLVASPECIFHSRARGGRPINDQRRASAFCVCRWAEALQPGVILVENVEEFADWGPLGANGRPLKSKRGETFRAWKGVLESLGYKVDHQVFCAADFGDPTTRERLFVQAVRGRRKINWPTPTHFSPREGASLFESQPWVPVRECIDFTIPSRSIYGRKKPLAEKTLRRIEIGLHKFGLKPFIVQPGHGNNSPGADNNRATSADAPIGVIPCSNRFAVAQPFLVKLRGTSRHGASIDAPAPTITARGQHLGLAEPFLVEVNHGNGREKNGNRRRARSIHEPLGALTTSNGLALCQPFVIGQQSGAAPRSVDEPAPTVATAGAISLVQPFIVSIDHRSGKQVRGADEPLSTITTKARHAVAQPFLIKYYGTADGQSIDEPLDTVTTKARFGLAMPELLIDGERYLLDIHFRMLKPRELARAQGFPDEYDFVGNQEQIVCQIGNAVPGNLAEALIAAAVPAAKEITRAAA